MRLNLHKQGLSSYKKLSYPARFGRYHELITPTGTYHLCLDGFPKFFQARDRWPHPQEWLKITRGGDAVYYSSLGYRDLFDLTGEYYYPFLPYSSNSIFFNAPLSPEVMKQLRRKHDQLCGQAAVFSETLPAGSEQQKTIKDFSGWTWKKIISSAQHLHRLIQARVPVLPPDCRHLDYDVIPFVISDGCQANCGFCNVKTGAEFRVRSDEEINEQLVGLKEFFDEELKNYAGIFLGQHDALAAGVTKICRAMKKADEILGIGRGHVRQPTVCQFGSAWSLLATDDNDLQQLADQPYKFYINIGLESFDQNTLNNLRKPVSAEENRQAFKRIVAINRRYCNIEISVNLIFGEIAGSDHLNTILQVVNSENSRSNILTTLYLSPLAVNGFCRQNFFQALRILKSRLRVPVYPYLIQRL